MTREVFDGIQSFSDLCYVCNEEGYEWIVEDLIPHESLDEYVCEDIRYSTHHDTWVEIKDSLESIYDDGCYYRRDGCLNYEALYDEDLESWKEELREAVENDGGFETEDEADNDEYAPGAVEEDTPAEECVLVEVNEPFAIDEMLSEGVEIASAATKDNDAMNDEIALDEELCALADEAVIPFELVNEPFDALDDLNDLFM